ncbi:F-box protein PP2-B11-like [Nymphaea colorata]|nr:F-box protein PP2-B11-like [Nymphaea colorata]
MERYASSTSLPDLPENCITHILSLTTPRDVCRSSAVSSSFLSAASSDYVWERMLPPDIHQLLSRVSRPIPFSSKKELFFGLCSSPLIIDFDRKSFSLDRSSGKKCFMLSARELTIIWSDHEQYWRWINLPESRFPEVAELLNVCWLDISGKISVADLSPSTRYAAYFVFKHTNSSYGLDLSPAKLSIRVNDSPQVLSEHEAFIHPENAVARSRRSRRGAAGFRWRATESPPRSALCPRKGYGEWMEVEVGEFFTDDEGGEADFSLMQTAGQWKSGMLLEGLEIRPKY